MKPSSNPWSVNADEYPADGYSSDQLEFLLAYAVLAPSNYNTQPWLFRINASDVEIHADRRRAIRVIDPYDRELTLSCGAALFNLRTAAEYFGHRYEFELLPDSGNANLLARFRLGLKAETGAEDILLFHAIAQRRTNRQPFQPDPLPAEIRDELTQAAAAEGAWLQFINGEDARANVADLVAEADRRQWADKHFRQELANWVRAKPETDLDGIPAHDHGVKDWLAFAGPALIRTFDRGGGEAARDREIAVHSPTLALLGTEKEDWPAWLAAGQALQHVLLAARARNVWASFLCQPIEVPELRGQLAEMLGLSGYPHVLLRLGYGPEVPPTPRRSPRAMLIHHTNHGHA